MSYRDDPINFYIVVNKGAGMEKGKIAAHVGHATQKWVEHVIKRDTPWLNKIYEEWDNEGSAKITLVATQEQFDELKKRNPFCIIKDAGHTQVAPGTETVLAFIPMRKSKQIDQLKELKLF